MCPLTVFSSTAVYFYKPCISEIFVRFSWNWPRHSKFTGGTVRKADVRGAYDHKRFIFLWEQAKMYHFSGSCEDMSLQGGEAQLMIRTFWYSTFWFFSFWAVSLDISDRESENCDNKESVLGVLPPACASSLGAFAARKNFLLIFFSFRNQNP